MRGKLIGLLCDDFRIYYELILHLKERDLPFVSLSASEELPLNIGVVITTPHLLAAVKSKKKVACAGPEDVELTVNMALQMLSGKERFDEVVVGIDPGDRPGIAVLGDGEMLNTASAKSPEDAVDAVERARKAYSAERFRVRIGHGDKANRNRIIKAMDSRNIEFEVVDERRTTREARSQPGVRTGRGRLDVLAALQIARGRGRRLERLDRSFTRRELKLIQTRSREKSQGRITISKALAELVARGEITMRRALRLQGERTGRRKRSGK